MTSSSLTRENLIFLCKQKGPSLITHSALSNGQNKESWEDPESSTVLGLFCQGWRSTMPRTTEEEMKPTQTRNKNKYSEGSSCPRRITLSALQIWSCPLPRHSTLVTRTLRDLLRLGGPQGNDRINSLNKYCWIKFIKRKMSFKHWKDQASKWSTLKTQRLPKNTVGVAALGSTTP